MESKQRDKFRFCKMKTCRKPFRVGRSMSYCDDCLQERSEARRKRKKERRRELKYPKGFGKARKQLEMIECQCVVCLMNQADHQKKHGCELEEHHVIMAKVAQQFGDPHASFNLTPLCVGDHGRMRAADEALLRNDWLKWCQESIAGGLPREVLIGALDGYGIGWGRLPL